MQSERMIKEKDVLKGCIDYLRLRGFYCQRINTGKIFIDNAFGKRVVNLADEGTPDILACISGKFVGIEIKKDEKEFAKWENQYQKYLQTGVMTKASRKSVVQHEQQNLINNTGGCSFTTFSIDHLEHMLKSHNLL